ncbi:MAG: glutamate--tRNA ligase [Actinobacteria bacterium]|nr:glutamate--tRNA ligase [Actinomycetota bacterium]
MVHTDTPRVRFAPAPSGWLHVGGARTALFNWLTARHGGGTFVLRIEDTDADRVTSESARGLMAALRFLGLDWDEGPDTGGPHGPYRQSERRPLYAAVADALREAGHAYEAFETPEELEAERRLARQTGLPPGYRGGHRDLTEEERAAFRARGRAPVLRLRTPDEGVASFDDVVRGRVEFAWADVSDFVIQRADGSPTYLLANPVDDLAMGIDTIARGEDLLSATPRQLLVHELLEADCLLDRALDHAGLPPRPSGPAGGSAGLRSPRFAHLPLLVGEDRRPLSKRHGSVAVDEFRRQGFLPEVLVNFLALCGWSHDGVRERFTVDELVALFSLDRVGRNPAYFDTDKLRALNGDRIRQLSDAELAERLAPCLAEADLVDSPPGAAQRRLVEGLAPLLRERIQTLAEAVPLVAWLFRETVEYDGRAVARHLRKGPAAQVLRASREALGELGEWTGPAILAALDGVAEGLGLGRGKTFQPVRVAVTGTAVSPPLPETLALLDRATVLARLRDAERLTAAPA